MSTLLKSYSGDWFEVPDGKEDEIKEYREAVKILDEKTMLKFEEGRTGWKYREN